jgi:hypothetical protein
VKKKKGASLHHGKLYGKTDTGEDTFAVEGYFYTTRIYGLMVKKQDKNRVTGVACFRAVISSCLLLEIREPAITDT